MKHTKFVVMALTAVLLVPLLSAGASAADKRFVAIATGGTGGVYYPLGGALAQIISNKVPNVAATAQSGNASAANVNLISRKEVETAFVQNNVAHQAYHGQGKYKGRTIKNIRAIASLYPEFIQIVASKESGIKYVTDFKGKVIGVGDRGSGTEIDASNILTAHGLTYKDIKPDFVGFSVGAQRIKDNQDHAVFITAGVPTAAVIDMTTSKPCNLVSLTPEAVQQLTTDFPYYVGKKIPAGTYSGQTEDVQGIAMMALWVVGEEVSEDLVYEMTKALWTKTPLLHRKKKEELSGAEILAKVHSQGKSITLDTALDGVTIPLHPGAEKFYKEAGLIK